MKGSEKKAVRLGALTFMREHPDAAFSILKAGGYRLHDGYAWAGRTRLEVPTALAQAFARGIHERRGV